MLNPPDGSRTPVLLATALVVLATVVVGRAPANDPATAQSPRPPAADGVVAYGGYAAVAPENTLAAIRAAADAGIPRVWLDVRATSDGVPVVLRDATLDRTTDCTGSVATQTAADVDRCDAGTWFDPRFAAERVPRLADALAAAGPRFDLMLHDAEAGGIGAILAAITAAGAADRVTLISASETALANIETRAPAIPKWLRVAALTPDVAPAVQRLGADGVAVDPAGLATDLALALDSAGIPVAVVGAEDEQAWFRAVGLRVDRVATERAEPLIRALGYQFRTYAATAFDTAALPQQAFARALAVGDFNADRRADLAVGAPLDASRAPGGGWAGVGHGGAAFPGPRYTEAGTERDAQWGAAFAVGDFNDDATDDLAVGYPLRDFNGLDSGIIWLWDGGPGGAGRLRRPIGPQLGGGELLGTAMAVGDFNADGVDDLVAGTPGKAVQGQNGAGQVLVLPGLAGAGPSANGALAIDREGPDVPGNPTARELVGSVVAAGDFDGDGYADVAIGVPEGDTPDVRDAGTILVAFGGPNDPMTRALAAREVVELSRAEAAIPGEAERDSGFGTALAVADFDADGRDDLAVGAPGATIADRKGAGDVVVLYGGEDGFDLARSMAIDQDTPLVPDAAEPRDAFGGALAAGDVDGDGRPDLVIGAPHEGGDGGTGDAGGVTIVYGAANGLQPRISLALAPGLPPNGVAPALRLGFGQALAIGDLNGDAVPDVAIGAPGMAVDGATAAGALVVAWSYSPDLPAVPTATVYRPSTTTATPTRPVTPSATPTPSITPTASATPLASATPTASATPRPPQPAYLPITVRLRAFPGYWPTPLPEEP